jgi:spore germination cell wall hydrolase CwlJ-like protein
MAVGAAALMGFAFTSPTSADDQLIAYVAPAQISPALEAQRMQPLQLRPAYAAPQLTNDLLQAYVARQQQLKSFDSFDVNTGELNTQVLLGYIERTRGTSSLALDAIDSIADQPALSDDVLQNYAKKFVPTVKKVQLSKAEQLCLTQAIYHEARGESEQGQWAVANVIINRAMSKKFPTTLCGVVYQNADQGFHRCQFTFACDGKSDFGTETGAWNRATKMAAVAYREFSQGERPGVIPANALYYHTVSVNPDWGPRAKRVATIGAHEFYALN